jgi:hypothetical protein
MAATYTENCDAMKRECDGVKTALHTALSAKNEACQKNTHLTQKLQELQQQLQRKEAERAELCQQNAVLKQQLQRKEAERADLCQQNAVLEEQLLRTEAERADLCQQNAVLKQQLQQQLLLQHSPVGEPRMPVPRAPRAPQREPTSPPPPPASPPPTSPPPAGTNTFKIIYKDKETCKRYLLGEVTAPLDYDIDQVSRMVMEVVKAADPSVLAGVSSQDDEPAATGPQLVFRGPLSTYAGPLSKHTAAGVDAANEELPRIFETAKHDIMRRLTQAARQSDANPGSSDQPGPALSATSGESSKSGDDNMLWKILKPLLAFGSAASAAPDVQVMVDL